MQNAITRHKISQILQKKKSENQKHYDEEPEIEIRESHTYEGIQNMYEEGIRTSHAHHNCLPLHSHHLNYSLCLNKTIKEKEKNLL